MKNKKLLTAIVLAAPLALGLTGCGVELPTPPVDGIEQSRKEEQERREADESRARAAAEAQAQQTGLIEGGPSSVTAAQRLQFLKSQDVTIEYKALMWVNTNSETSELTIPANSRVLQEGVQKKLSEVPAIYNEAQLLPKADLNGKEITILNMTLRSDALVLTILGDKAPLENLNAEGTLLLKAPKELRNLCEEGPNVDCSGRNLFGRDWTGKVYNGIIAVNSNATSLNAPAASLINSDFSGAQLFRGNFLGANVSGSKFRGIKGQNIMMNSDNRTEETLTKAVNTDFTGSYLYRCEFDYTDLTGSIWDKTDAQNCTFDNATMPAFRASGAWLHRIKASNVNMNSAIAPNVRLSQGTFTKSDLSYSNLSGGLLDRIEAQSANFTKVILTGENCTMSQSYLDGARLVGMQAAGCTFTRASMKNVNASWLNASSADLTYTDLKGANFTNANLLGANLFNSDTKGVIMDGAQLIGATCPNGDIVGKTKYGRYANKTVTGCSWNNPNYSVAGSEIFENKSLPVAGKILRY